MSAGSRGRGAIALLGPCAYREVLLLTSGLSGHRLLSAGKTHANEPRDITNTRRNMQKHAHTGIRMRTQTA